jgi:hypothetical protein
MRGGAVSDRVVLIRPSNSITSRQSMVFEWRPVATAVYRFLLVDEQGNKTIETDVGEPRHELPPGVTLAEGKPYVWGVSARNRLVFGLALEQRGLKDEATRYWSELASDRPELRPRAER